jgi:hypothetical protein
MPKIFFAVSLALIAFFQATGIGGIGILWIAFALSVISGTYTIFDEWPEKTAKKNTSERGVVTLLVPWPRPAAISINSPLQRILMQVT